MMEVNLSHHGPDAEPSVCKPIAVTRSVSQEPLLS
jgi:hypothetical protein